MDTRKLVKLLLLIEKQNRITQTMLAESLHVSRQTINRLIGWARKDFGVVLDRPAGPNGTYEIKSWGILDRAAAVRFNASSSRKGK